MKKGNWKKVYASVMVALLSGVTFASFGAEALPDQGESTESASHFVSVNYDKDSDTTTGNYNNDGAKGEGSIAVGKDAESDYLGSIAIGNEAKGLGFDGQGISHYAGTSIAIGDKASAQGGSVAIGEKASGIALGDVALGRGAKAEGTSKFTASGTDFGGAVSIGNYSNAKGGGAVAIGLRTKTNGNYAIAIGGSGTTKAEKDYSIAIGDATWATAQNAFAVGRTARATAEDGIAVGRGTQVRGSAAIALGYGASASADNSVAIGTLSSASGYFGTDTISLFSGSGNHDKKMGIISVGYNNGGERRIVNVAGGVNATDAVNVGQLQSIVEKIGYTTGDDGKINNGGDQTILSRLSALEGSAGGSTSESHFLSINYGDTNKDAGNYNNDGAKAEGAIAIGMDNEANEKYSIAIGKNVTATGDKLVGGYDSYYYPAIGLGKDVKAIGADAIAIGRDVRAEGRDAVAFGRNAIAEGEGTLALGFNAIAQLAPNPNAGKGYNYALAVGALSKAYAPGASAFGHGSAANAERSLAVGDFAGVYGESGIAIGDQAKAGLNSDKAYTNGIAIGTESASAMNDALAFGRKAKANAESSAAIGRESETSYSYTDTTALFTGAANKDSTDGVVTFGRDKRGFFTKEINRRLLHVAGGVDDTDAVNMGQLKAIVEKIGYTTGTDGKIDNAGDKTLIQRVEDLEKNKPTSGGSGGTSEVTVTSKAIEKPNAEQTPTKYGQTVTLTDGSGKESVIDDVASADKLAEVDQSVAKLQEEVGDRNYSKIKNKSNTLADGDSFTTAISKLNDKLSNIKAGDAGKSVTGGSINDKGQISLKQQDGTDVTLDGAIKDVSVKQGDYAVKDGKVEIGLVDNYSKADAGSFTISDIAKASDVELLGGRVDQLDSRIDKVGAGAAALAALHPLEYDPDSKWDVSAGYGNFRGENALALGAFYRPNENTLFSLGGSFGNGENMLNAGISFKLGQGGSGMPTSRVAMAREITDLKAENQQLKNQMDEQKKEMDAKIQQLIKQVEALADK